MDPEGETKRKAKEEANKDSAQGSKSGGDPLITKSEMKNEMRSMIKELLEMGMIAPRWHLN
jgi:hypothetical protein